MSVLSSKKRILRGPPAERASIIFTEGKVHPTDSRQ